ncbi:MAG: 23S rRNA (guanosine(2251)-2'-O)-methyltransferase RlmB [Vampirovibrionales bacterium]
MMMAPYTPSKPSHKKSFGKSKAFGEKKSFGKKSFGDKERFGDRPRTEGSFEERKPYGERKSFGDRKPFGDRERFSARPRGERSFEERKPYGERKSFGDRERFNDSPRDERPRRKTPAFFEMAHQSTEEHASTALDTNELMAIGRQSVQTILEVAPDRIQKILFAGEEPPTRGTAKDLWQLAKMLGKRVDTVPKVKLDQMLLQQQESLLAEGHLQAQVESLYHQGVIAILSPQKLWTLESWHEEVLAPHENQGKPALVVLCDGITDARNFGAILRVAEGAGAVGVIIGKHRSASFSVGVSKTACGADQTMPVIQVTNLNHAQSYLKELGFWSVGTVLDTEAQAYQTIDYATRTVLVLGSEDEGVSKQLIKHCDFKTYIPMLGKVQSLNVATAAAVMAFHIQGHWHAKAQG